jgi:cyclic pyranopterin phosphate synthase
MKSPMSRLTHFDAQGRAVMVDVSDKAETERIAVAKGRVTMRAATLKLILGKGVEKGDVLAVAQLAGIAGAKRTPDLVPLCHPLALTSVKVELTPVRGKNAVDIEARVKTTGRTGVEMEALTAVAVAALTVYDMCKAVDRGMVLSRIRLEHKSGGKSGTYRRKPGSYAGKRRNSVVPAHAGTHADASSMSESPAKRRRRMGPRVRGDDTSGLMAKKRRKA